MSQACHGWKGAVADTAELAGFCPCPIAPGGTLSGWPWAGLVTLGDTAPALGWAMVASGMS